MIQLDLPTPASTDALGAALAATRPGRAVVHLIGDLGAGKSTLARAFLRALGVQGAIRSPTYTLLERYPLAVGEAWHMDLYRIADPGELEFLGVDSDDATLWLVEWPDRGTGALPPADVEIRLVVAGEGRSVALTALSSAAHAWITAAAAVFTSKISTPD